MSDEGGDSLSDIEEAVVDAQEALNEALADSPFTTNDEAEEPDEEDVQERAEAARKASKNLQSNLEASPLTAAGDDESDGVNIGGEVGDALEEASDALQSNVERSAFTTEEERDADPTLAEVSVDVDDTPEYTFPSVRELRERAEETLRGLEESVGAEALATPAFWQLLDEEIDADVPRGGLEPPSMEADSAPSPVRIIQETDPETVVEQTPGEGEVETVTDPDDIDRATSERWTNTLAQVRSLDQKLDRLSEARSNLRRAQRRVAERIEELDEDRDLLLQTIDATAGDDQRYRDALAEVEDQMEVGEELLPAAEEKMAVIEERGEALVSDRNAYRGEVKALYKYALDDESGADARQFEEEYRGYRLRSGSDVPFRPDVVRHIFSVMHTFEGRGQLPADYEAVMDRTMDTWDYDRSRVGGAIELLTITGEVWPVGEELRFSPLTGG